MTRPTVQIQAHNQILAFRRHLEGMLLRFTSFEGVVGITLNGGMSRGYADQFSEIDITFYLEPEAFQSWKHGKTPVAVGITVLDGQVYDIKYVDHASERKQEWESIMLWDASYAEILYDPKGRLHELFAEKLSAKPDLSLVESLLMSCWWYNELAGDIWIHRGDALQGHYVFNQAVVPLLQALFVANREFIPHEKWLLHMSRSLEWVPVSWERRLSEAMSTSDLTVASLRARQTAIRRLWEEVDRYMIETYYPHLPVHVMQKSVYEHLKLLVESGSMSLPGWRAQTGLDIPNGDPFYPLIRLDQDRIVLDRDALLRIGPEAMYAWHYAVLQAVAAGSQR